jgi:hypothetical protein
MSNKRQIICLEKREKKQVKLLLMMIVAYYSITDTVYFIGPSEGD